MIDNGEKNNTGLLFDLAEDTMKLFGCPHQSVDVFDRPVVGILRGCGACHRIQGFAGRVRHQMEMKESRLRHGGNVAGFL